MLACFSIKQNHQSLVVDSKPIFNYFWKKMRSLKTSLHKLLYTLPKTGCWLLNKRSNCPFIQLNHVSIQLIPSFIQLNQLSIQLNLSLNQLNHVSIQLNLFFIQLNPSSIQLNHVSIQLNLFFTQLNKWAIN